MSWVIIGLLIAAAAFFILWGFCIVVDGKRREKAQGGKRAIFAVAIVLISSSGAFGESATNGGFGETALPSPHKSDGWTGADTAMEVTWQVLHAVEMGQTLDLARQPDRYYERFNPLLGTHPTTGKVYAWAAASSLAHAGISYLLPKEVDLWGMKIPVRNAFQAVSIAWTTGMVVNNFEVGLRIRF